MAPVAPQAPPPPPEAEQNTSQSPPYERPSALRSGPYGTGFATALTRPTSNSVLRRPPKTIGKTGETRNWATVWARVRETFGLTDPCVAIRPQDNILIGHETIMAYLGLRSRATLDRYIDEYALPAIRRPSDGRLMSSVTSIDQWIISAAKASHANRHKEGKTTYQRRAEREDRAARLFEPGVGPLPGHQPTAPGQVPAPSAPPTSPLQRGGPSLLPDGLRPKAISRPLE